MGDEHGGDADATDQLADLPAGALAQRGVQIGERLVQQEHPRLGGQRTGQRHALLLPAGELVHAAPLQARQVDQLERARDPLRQLGAAHVERLEPEADILADVEVGEQRVVLEHHPEPAMHRFHPGDILALDQDAPLVRGLEPGQQPEHRGLAAAAGPQEREHLAPCEGQRDLLGGDHAVEALGEAFDREKRRHRVAMRSPPRTCRSQ